MRLREPRAFFIQRGGFWLSQPGIAAPVTVVSLPMVIGVWKTKNVRVGIYTHILLNTIGKILALMTVLHPAELQVPANHGTRT